MNEGGKEAIYGFVILHITKEDMVHGHVQMMVLASLMMDSHRFFHCVGPTTLMHANFASSFSLTQRKSLEK